MTTPEREQDQDLKRTADQGQEKGATSQGKGVRSRWDALPRIGKVLGVTLTTAGAIVGILAAFGLIGPHPSPPQPTGYFQGLILGQTGLPVRKSPELSGAVTAVLQPGTTVFIVCTKEGDAVTGPGHGGGTITTRVWDYVRTATSAYPLGFVPDALVNTHSVKPTERHC